MIRDEITFPAAIDGDETRPSFVEYAGVIVYDCGHYVSVYDSAERTQRHLGQIMETKPKGYTARAPFALDRVNVSTIYDGITYLKSVERFAR